MINVCEDFHTTRVSLNAAVAQSFVVIINETFFARFWLSIFISSTAIINRKWEHFSHISTIIAITPIVFHGREGQPYKSLLGIYTRYWSQREPKMVACFVSAHSIMDTPHFRATQFMGRETVMLSYK